MTTSHTTLRSRTGLFGARTLVASVVVLVLNWATPAPLHQFGSYATFDSAQGLAPGARIHPLNAPRALPRHAHAEIALPQAQKSGWSLGDGPDGLPLRTAAEYAACVCTIVVLAGGSAALGTTPRGFDARAPPLRL